MKERNPPQKLLNAKDPFRKHKKKSKQIHFKKDFLYSMPLAFEGLTDIRCKSSALTPNPHRKKRNPVALQECNSQISWLVISLNFEQIYCAPKG